MRPMSTESQTGKSPSAKRRIGPPRSLGDLIGRHLAKKRTTAAALARKAGIDKSLLSKVLSGKQRTMDHENIILLAKAMEIDWSKFYTAQRASKMVPALKSEINTFRHKS